MGFTLYNIHRLINSLSYQPYKFREEALNLQNPLYTPLQITTALGLFATTAILLSGGFLTCRLRMHWLYTYIYIYILDEK